MEERERHPAQTCNININTTTTPREQLCTVNYGKYTYLQRKSTSNFVETSEKITEIIIKHLRFQQPQRKFELKFNVTVCILIFCSITNEFLLETISFSLSLRGERKRRERKRKEKRKEITHTHTFELKFRHLSNTVDVIVFSFLSKKFEENNVIPIC